MAIKQLDPRMINPGEKFTNTDNTFISNLTSDNVVATNITLPGGNSNTWNDVSTVVQANSALWEESADITAITTTVQSNSAFWDTAYATTTALSSDFWNDVYTTVQSNSASWEESADILPTVTNYLSTSNVFINSLTSNNIITSNISITGNDTFILSTNSTAPTLRVTQTGTGNAILVEDSTNPDATPFAINQYGQIISGTLSAWNALASLQITTDSAGSAPNSTLALKSNSNIAAGPLLVFYKGRGTHEAPLELSANDTLGGISFFGHSPESGTGNVPRYRSAAQISVQTDGTPVSSLSSNPSRIMFLTTLSGDSSATERLRITHDGKVGIGTSIPNETLTITGNVSATGTVYSANTLTTSVCAMSGDGITPFVMDFTNGLLTSITF